MTAGQPEPEGDPRTSDATSCCGSMTRPFKSFWEGTCSLGRREGVEEAAESQRVSPDGSFRYMDDKVKEPLEDGTIVVVERSDTSSLLVGTIYTTQEKDTAAGRALDEMVSIAGSRLMFGGVLTIIVGWAIAGAVLGAPDLWQIILQDTSSIQCYISDMILMRQQMNDFCEHLRIIAILRSRSDTVARCFDILLEQGRLQSATSQLGRTSTMSLARLSTRMSSLRSSRGTGRVVLGLERANPGMYEDVEGAAQELDAVGDGASLHTQDFIDRVIGFIADIMGSIWMLLAFCAGMIAWIALGPKYGFSDNWQLWLNTCTALQQTLSTCLLTLARNRHAAFIEKCMCAIFRQDCEVEYQARALTGYGKSNDSVRIECSADSRFSRALNWYAALIGSGYGAAISALLFAGWIAAGDAMSWGDNWWLIVGTWTGLAGTFNAAVLRYSLYREEQKGKTEYDRLIAQDKAIFRKLGLRGSETSHSFVPTLMSKISMFASRMCASPWAVTGTLALIIGLLIGATAVLWNETAQLLVNSVTMIVESFFLIVLIDAHNIQATDHRVRLHDLLIRRLQLLVILKRVEEEGDALSKTPLEEDSPDAGTPKPCDADLDLEEEKCEPRSVPLTADIGSNAGINISMPTPLTGSSPFCK